MKNLKVTKTIVLYNKDDEAIKQIDVSNFTWKMIYVKAVIAHQVSIYSAYWRIIVEPKE
jgi:hypothetical protein